MMKLKEALTQLMQDRLEAFVGNQRISILDDIDMSERIQRKRLFLHHRGAELLKVSVRCEPLFEHTEGLERHVEYLCEYYYFIEHKGTYYGEEEQQIRKAVFYRDKLIQDVASELVVDFRREKDEGEEWRATEDGNRTSFYYSRLNAVKYAETYWGKGNSKYPFFENNCTNYISQCLHAGEAKMKWNGNEGKGWWFGNQRWSYSWAVSHSLFLHLQSAQTGLRGKAVSDPRKLLKGDLIFYDFQGDGRWDHVTIVTHQDPNNEPLVNANTFNCRKRHWSYEDSTAYTPNMKYKFIRIIDDTKSS